MKRTNLVLDEDLLKTATRMIGAKTYSEAVNLSLREMIRSFKARGLHEFIGKGIWEGSLSMMREDSTETRQKTSKRKR